MATQQMRHEKRMGDPYMDRRCGEDRRQVHFIGFFSRGGTERRRSRERREGIERRDGCIQVTDWSSVCVDAISGNTKDPFQDS